jgi:hypothetical protein
MLNNITKVLLRLPRIAQYDYATPLSSGKAFCSGWWTMNSVRIDDELDQDGFWKLVRWLMSWTGIEIFDA